MNNNASLGDYYRGIRYEMLPFIPQGCNTSLEVGCGDGNFSVALQEQFQIKEAWGMELNEEVAELAKNKINKVLVGNAEVAVEALPDKFFDLVVFNDSLEHLSDPWKFLNTIFDKLSPQGYVVASIPNVRHYKNLYKLIFKKQWHYEDSGILDRTHLRFFTQESIKEMFEQCRYNINTLQGINATRKKKIKLLSTLSMGLFEDIRYLQFAVVAQKKN